MGLAFRQVISRFLSNLFVCACECMLFAYSCVVLPLIALIYHHLQAACVSALSRQVHAVLCSSTLRHLRAKSLPRHDTLVDQGASLLAHSHQLLLDIADQLPRNSPTHACLMKEVRGGGGLQCCDGFCAGLL